METPAPDSPVPPRQWRTVSETDVSSEDEPFVPIDPSPHSTALLRRIVEGLARLPDHPDGEPTTR